MSFADGYGIFQAHVKEREAKDLNPKRGHVKIAHS
jgi:hypothetical protein